MKLLIECPFCLTLTVLEGIAAEIAAISFFNCPECGAFRYTQPENKRLQYWGKTWDTIESLIAESQRQIRKR